MVTLLTWAAYAVAGLLHMLATRAAVRLVGRGADNAWDNAFGYVTVAYFLTWPARWLIATKSLWAIALIPGLYGVISLFVLAVIYEVSTRRAVIIGLVHGIFCSLFYSVFGLLVGFVAAWIMYGRIVADPLILLRIVLRLIGIDPPF